MALPSVLQKIELMEAAKKVILLTALPLELSGHRNFFLGKK